MVLKNADGIEVFYPKSSSCLDQGAGAQQLGAPRTLNFLIRRHRSFTQAMAAAVDTDNLPRGGPVDSLLINSSPTEFFASGGSPQPDEPIIKSSSEQPLYAATIARSQLPPRIQLFLFQSKAGRTRGLLPKCLRAPQRKG